MHGWTKQDKTATRIPRTQTLCAKCQSWRGQLGLEPSPKMYVMHIVQIFREIRRVLKPGSPLWVNLGDTWYSAAGNGRTMGGSRFDHYRRVQQSALGGYPKMPPSRLPIDGLKGKDLVGIPWMVAFALREEGYWLRSEVVWHKPNGIAKVADDRPAGIHETIFLLANAKKYYYDHKANSEPASDSERRRRERERARGKTANYKLKRDQFANPPGATSCLRNLDKRTELAISGIRRRRSVWQIAVTPYSGDHSSMFPLRIAEVCIAAGCPEGGVVLDPFCGMATVGVMALRMGRKFVGIEAAHKTCVSARERIQSDAPMFNSREVGRLAVESAQAALFA